MKTISPTGSVLQSAMPSQTSTGSSRGVTCARVLLVNDMQATFSASNNLELLAAVTDEIKTAMEAGWLIVVVEYDPVFEGQTHSSLLQLLHDYPHVLFVSKTLERVMSRMMAGDRSRPNNEDDGSEQVIAVLENHGVINIDRVHFRVCGVNTDSCVLKTVRGLRQRLPACELTLVLRACNSIRPVSARVLQEFEDLVCLVI